jgi:hypothetical protein
MNVYAMMAESNPSKIFMKARDMIWWCFITLLSGIIGNEGCI